jgi:hypothetical protein
MSSPHRIIEALLQLFGEISDERFVAQCAINNKQVLLLNSEALLPLT